MYVVVNISIELLNVHKEWGQTRGKAWKCEPFKYHGLFVCVCMVTRFRLRVFDAFTLFVYMFTLICMALPQPATRLTFLPPPTTTQMCNNIGSKQRLVVWAQVNLLSFLT